MKNYKKYLLAFVMLMCTYSINAQVVYTSEISDTTKAYIYTENGTINFDTVRVMFDDYIHKYDASPVFVDDHSDGNYSPIIVNGFGKPILFNSDESLIYYMLHRGYNFDGLESMRKRKRYQSVWVFIKK